MVIFSDVSKKFVVPGKERNSLLRAIVNSIKRQDADKTIWALNKVSLCIENGEIIGIIGPNGSGKSTLLRIIAGIYKATSGAVEVKGHATSVLQLGVGFLPDLSLRENIFLFGAILGLEREYISKNFSRIIDFSGLAEFINAEVRTLSMGMKERLAFSIIVHAWKDILLLDEALATGDQRFKERCFEIIKGFKKSKKTVIFSSHDMNMATQLCDRVLLLNKGQVVAFDKPEYIMARYMELSGEDLNNPGYENI